MLIIHEPLEDFRVIISETMNELIREFSAQPLGWVRD